MPVKRITINQGCQPHTPLRGNVSCWGSMRKDCAEVWWLNEEDQTFLTLPVTEQRGHC